MGFTEFLFTLMPIIKCSYESLRITNWIFGPHLVAQAPPLANHLQSQIRKVFSRLASQFSKGSPWSDGKALSLGKDGFSWFSNTNLKQVGTLWMAWIGPYSHLNFKQPKIWSQSAIHFDLRLTITGKGDNPNQGSKKFIPFFCFGWVKTASLANYWLKWKKDDSQKLLDQFRLRWKHYRHQGASDLDAHDIKEKPIKPIWTLPWCPLLGKYRELSGFFR